MSLIEKASVTSLRKIPGFPTYFVDSSGNAYSERLHGSSRTDGKIRRLAPGVGTNEYLSISLRKDGKTHQRLLHRLVCLAFHGAPTDPRMETSHRDGDRSNNRADNLLWEIRRDNHARKLLHGTDERGWKSASALLTEDQAKEVVRLLKAGVTPNEIGETFGVRGAMIRKIKRKEIYKNAHL